MNQTPNRTGAPAGAASAGDEPKVVIRPAGALPTGVRASPPTANAAAIAAANAASRAAAKGKPKPKAKGKTAVRKPAVPRQPLTRRLAARARDMRFRLLPVTIFVAVLMLGVRVGDLWRLATHEARLPDFPVSLAESKTPPPPRQVAANGAEPAPPGAAAPAGAMAPAGAPAEGAAPAAGDAASGDLKPLGPVTNEELLKHFAERRAEIEKRTKELEQREALLTAAEKRIDQKVQEMDKVRADIQKMMRQGDEKQQAQIESLVTIYENMKPQDAARIFEKLDMPVLLDVIQKMKEKKTAPILAAMDPTKAKEVTAALIDRQSVPGSVTR